MTLVCRNALDWRIVDMDSWQNAPPQMDSATSRGETSFGVPVISPRNQPMASSRRRPATRAGRRRTSAEYGNRIVWSRAHVRALCNLCLVPMNPAPPVTSNCMDQTPTGNNRVEPDQLVRNPPFRDQSVGAASRKFGQRRHQVVIFGEDP